MISVSCLVDADLACDQLPLAHKSVLTNASDSYGYHYVEIKYVACFVDNKLGVIV